MEVHFMNQLSPSLRAVAEELFLNESLDSLVEMRLVQVSNKYRKQYALTPSKWTEVLNAVTLTRLTQFSLGKHLEQKRLEQMNDLVLLLLTKEGEWVETTLEELQGQAKVFLAWHAELLKMIK